MSDIRTVWRDAVGTWVVAGPSLAMDAGLETAVVISLFTDRLAAEDDALPYGVTGRRGWWGDAYAAQSGDLIGSRLWMLAREKQGVQALRRAEEYAREALQWLVTDGVASQVGAVATIVRSGVLGLEVSITRSAEPVVRFRFDTFWKGA